MPFKLTQQIFRKFTERQRRFYGKLNTSTISFISPNENLNLHKNELRIRYGYKPVSVMSLPKGWKLIGIRWIHFRGG